MADTHLDDLQGLRLLSLDGGGVRGISELLIIREIMERIKAEENLPSVPLPCRYFDLIGGTGTGGIVALLLGRLQMTIQEAIDCYKTIIEQVFTSTKWKTNDGHFKATKLETVMKDIVKRKTGSAQENMLDHCAESKVCKTFVVSMAAYNMSAGIPRLWRTYTVSKNVGYDCAVWEAARATSATPTFFKCIHIGGAGAPKEPFVDGGMGRNNPVALVLEEAQLVFPGRRVACVVSIGAGQPERISVQPDRNWLQSVLPADVMRALRDIATDCEKSHEDIQKRFVETKHVYFRFNVEQGMQNIRLDHGERSSEVASHTIQYMAQETVKQALSAMVKTIRSRASADAISTEQLNGVILVPPRFAPKICPLPSPLFTGREDVLSKMMMYFFTSPMSVQSGKQRVFSVVGPTGSGKSEIAFEFVRRCQGSESLPLRRFSRVLFVDASTSATIAASFADIARAFGGESTDDALQRLIYRREEWLLLFDNVDLVEPIIELRSYLPSCGHGNILITSCHSELAGVYAQSSCSVAGMAPNDGVALLIAAIGGPKTANSNGWARPIVHELNYFAGAIAQAGVFISAADSGVVFPKNFLGTYRRHRAENMEIPDINGTQWMGYTTWQNSLSNTAATLLRLCVFMHTDSISERIFEASWTGASINAENTAMDTDDARSMVVDFLAKFRTLEGHWDSEKFRQVTDEIVQYSLMDFEKGNLAFSVQQPMRSWIRDTMGDGQKMRACTLWLLAFSVPPEDTAEEYAFRRLLLRHIDEARGDDIQLPDFVNEHFISVYYEASRWDVVEKLELESLERKEKRLGKSHPETLRSMNNLASTYRNQGRSKDAEKLEKQLVDLCETVFGKSHPLTLKAMANLASTYKQKGQWNHALPIETYVMGETQRVEGDEHPDTLRSMGNLASTYKSLGRWKQAEELEVKVLEASKKVFGPNHPSMLRSLGNLAYTYRNQGQLDKARELEEQVVDTSKKVHGDTHPATLRNMANLAGTYRSLGHLRNAEGLQMQVAQMTEKVLGTEHPETLRSRSDLAVTYRMQNRLTESEDLAKEVEDARRKVLGPEHPDTLKSTNNLAMTYLAQGQLAKAEESWLNVIDIKKRVMGEEHPETLTSMSNLASTYRDQGRLEESEKLGLQVLQMRQRLLGAKHPSTLLSMSNMATLYRMQGVSMKADNLDQQIEDLRRKAGA